MSGTGRSAARPRLPRATVSRWLRDHAVGRMWTPRLSRDAWLALLGGLTVYDAIRVIDWAASWPHVVGIFTPFDNTIYMAQAHRVLAGGSLYPAWELAGPFTAAQSPQLYPPLTVYGLFVPLSLLPTPLWWLLPLGVIAIATWHLHPSRWAWLGIAACLSLPATWEVVTAGNPSIWSAAALAVATITPAAGPLVLLKPALAPFALMGIRHRAWWLAAVVLLLVSIPLGGAWVDYARVLANYRAPLPLVPKELPLMLVPLIAWVGREQSGPTGRLRAGFGTRLRTRSVGNLPMDANSPTA